MTIKADLYNLCKLHIEKRAATIEKTIRSNQNALQSETKSSAGDKHETGRAMLQLEMEKAGQQLTSISLMNETLAKVNMEVSSNFAHLGSVVYTTKGNYFLSISAGKIILDDKVFFAISVSSPIGKLLLGKQIGDTIVFNENTIEIETIL